ncbi:MAG: hypothetical protein AB8G96_01565 [Phycisphaerales bacterium]
MAATRTTTLRRLRRGLTAGGLLVVTLMATGCAESRRARYEQMLKGEVVRADVADARFAAAFPETATLRFATADVD